MNRVTSQQIDPIDADFELLHELQARGVKHKVIMDKNRNIQELLDVTRGEAFADYSLNRQIRRNNSSRIALWLEDTFEALLGKLGPVFNMLGLGRYI